MGGVNGLQPFIITPLNATAGSALSKMPVNQPMTAQVESGVGGLRLNIGGIRVPIQNLPELRPGQEVLLELVRLGTSFQMRITPHQSEPGGTGYSSRQEQGTSTQTPEAKLAETGTSRVQSAGVPNPPSSSRSAGSDAPAQTMAAQTGNQHTSMRPAAVLNLSSEATQISAEKLPVNQPMMAHVEESPGGLFITVGGVRIPIQYMPELRPGQEILLELIHAGTSLQMRITLQHPASAVSDSSQQQAGASSYPQGIGQQEPPSDQPRNMPLSSTASDGKPSTDAQSQSSVISKTANTTTIHIPLGVGAAFVADNVNTSGLPDPVVSISSFEALVNQVMQALGISVSPETILSVVPTYLPLSEETVRALLTLMAGRNAVGEDLSAIRVLVDQAVAAGYADPSLRRSVESAIERILLPNDTSLRDILEHLVAAGRTGSTEVRLARVIQSNDVEQALSRFGEDFRTLLHVVRDDPGMERFLLSRGSVDSFRGLVNGVLDRMTGASVQNIRGLEQPYHFIDLAFSPNAPIRQGQIHIFGEGSRARGHVNPRHATVVLDLETTRLGNLWIHFAVTPGHCTCTFRGESKETVERIEDAGSELSHALSETGYPGAVVRARLWNGDRLSETSRLMSRFTGVQLKG